VKIALLGESESGINIFPKLTEKLVKKIVDAEVSEHFVRSLEDIPLKAKQLTKSNSLVFVFALYGEKTEAVDMVIEKLVSVELETGKKIIKAIEASDAQNLVLEDQFAEEKEELASKWSKVIVNELFSPAKFAPKEDIVPNEDGFI